MAPSDVTTGTAICAFCCLVIWIGLFTGLNVPQIRRTENYRETECFVNGSIILRRYCPVDCPIPAPRHGPHHAPVSLPAWKALTRIRAHSTRQLSHAPHSCLVTVDIIVAKRIVIRLTVEAAMVMGTAVAVMEGMVTEAAETVMAMEETTTVMAMAETQSRTRLIDRRHATAHSRQTIWRAP